MTVNALMAAFGAEPAAEILAQLSTPSTLAGVWDDLFRLAGEEVPAVVARAFDEPIHAMPRLAVRGSYADHRLEFPEAYTGWPPRPRAPRTRLCGACQPHRCGPPPAVVRRKERHH